ncbi:hypothetical protein VTJ04DRAFT_419, partial [Mycothermus thermophilus]|uniref:uncharacterized protein n=1 Tax=Humicola insolens TaxID=85995 RepID=UPI00374453CF
MASRSDTELLTEHFGYAPVSLLDEIINSVNFLAERALHSIEQGLLNAPPASLGFRPSTSSKAKQSKAKKNVNNKSGRSQLPDDEEEQQEQEEEDGEEAAARRHRDEIESGTHQLETLLWASIDKNFDVFEIYVMRNILCLRPNEMEWLRLRHYEGLDFGWVEKEKSRGGVKGNGTAAQGEAAKAVNGDGAEKEEEEDELVGRLRR